MIIYILTHDIILIGCGLGIVLGILSKLIITLIAKVYDKIEGRYYNESK